MYAIYLVNFALANLIAWVCISQLSHIIGFNNIIYICLIMVVLAFPAVVIMKFQGPWKNDTTQLEFFVGRELEKK